MAVRSSVGVVAHPSGIILLQLKWDVGAAGRRGEYGGNKLFSRLPQMPVTPSWFTAALAQQPEQADVEVDGCRIHLRVWGAADQPPVVLVHGGGAHSGWWDHIAPFFSHTQRVIALDLSGHGDSGARTCYDPSTWAREVMAAASAAGPGGRPTIVGHSMGGWVVSTAVMHYSPQINSMLVIDSPLWERVPEEGRLRTHKHTEYRTRDEILARFTTVPSGDFR